MLWKKSLRPIVSLISGESKPRRYKVDNQSFFMQRGYQVLLVLGLIAAFLLVMVYQTLFGRIEQPQQMVTIDQGQTYLRLTAAMAAADSAIFF